MGLIPGLACPHYNSHTLGLPRRRHFRAMIERDGGAGIALDNGCALVVRGDAHAGGSYQVIASTPNAHAYRLRKLNGRVVTQRIPAEPHPSPLAQLYE